MLFTTVKDTEAINSCRVAQLVKSRQCEFTAQVINDQNRDGWLCLRISFRMFSEREKTVPYWSAAKEGGVWWTKNTPAHYRSETWAFSLPATQPSCSTVKRLQGWATLPQWKISQGAWRPKLSWAKATVKSCQDDLEVSVILWDGHTLTSRHKSGRLVSSLCMLTKLSAFFCYSLH